MLHFRSSLSNAAVADRRGSVAIIFGICALVLGLMVGFAIDTARFYNVSTRVQAALDAAALAGAKAMDVDGATSADVQRVAGAYFEAHQPDIDIGGVSLTNFRAQPNWADASVRASVDIAMPTIFGTLASGSDTQNFVAETVTQYRSMKIEMSLVLDITGSMAPAGKLDALKVAATQLVDTLFQNDPNPGQVRVSLVPYSASVNAGSLHDDVTFGFFGDTCVVERNGMSAYTNTPPGHGRWLGTSSTASNPRYSCPPAAVVPLTDLASASDRANFNTRINAMTPIGATAGHIGLAWGWYLLSPSWNSLLPSASRPKAPSSNVLKVVILMTDGEFNTSYNNGNTLSTDVTTVGSSGYQALQLCDNVKADGIRIYSIAFMAPVNAENMLRTCSGDDNYFNADTSSELIDAFQAIASRLNSLRVSS
ncbi:MAG: pilus assembly protein TadG-related protein [Hyphomicrobium sp.]|nr:pilus assembly protein TadG-related protein [Hyphomicrobium sp.]